MKKSQRWDKQHRRMHLMVFVIFLLYFSCFVWSSLLAENSPRDNDDNDNISHPKIITISNVCVVISPKRMYHLGIWLINY
ncbi:hypothetical protein EUGRSUZ_G01143 [Eucalyptus grandis]|uniref:Uncharacterized protein n=2 Tax=Eucalyptus grandis TaxID=71139 RepID=A0ACC3K1Z9_EUCGR|nr:hypothetical protein EUGRSUZ_G01143 [Eucalyptus grandis]